MLRDWPQPQPSHGCLTLILMPYSGAMRLYISLRKMQGFSSIQTEEAMIDDLAVSLHVIRCKVAMLISAGLESGCHVI